MSQLPGKEPTWNLPDPMGHRMWRIGFAQANVFQTEMSIILV
jgi:hypothetical protein